MSRVGESASGLEEDVLDCRILVLRRGGRGQFLANGSQLRDSNATLMHEAFNGLSCHRTRLQIYLLALRIP
jgi:hypothetical protein